MQRLFTTFAGGWPGAGLLILRLIVGVPIFYQNNMPLGGTLFFQALTCIEALLGALLVVGLWTPAVALLQSVISLALFVAGYDPKFASVVTGLESLSLAMLGPGEWSVDARLFGRKRLKMSP